MAYTSLPVPNPAGPLPQINKVKPGGPRRDLHPIHVPLSGGSDMGADPSMPVLHRERLVRMPKMY